MRQYDSRTEAVVLTWERSSQGKKGCQRGKAASYLPFKPLSTQAKGVPDFRSPFKDPLTDFEKLGLYRMLKEKHHAVNVVFAQTSSVKESQDTQSQQLEWIKH